MRVLLLTTLYPGFIRRAYLNDPGLAGDRYVAQRQAFDQGGHGWAGVWTGPFATMGYTLFETLLNVEPLQRAWARENVGPASNRLDLREIALLQARAFQPDILWFDNHEAPLLSAIRQQVPSIKLVLGWTGEHLPQTDAWRGMDTVLSCSQEAVDSLRSKGVRSAQLHHGFNPAILSRLSATRDAHPVTFVGSVGGPHQGREEFLEVVFDSGVGLRIFTPAHEYGWKRSVEFVLRTLLFDLTQGLRIAGTPDALLNKMPFIRNAANWPGRPSRSNNKRLRQCFRPPVFGIEMFQVLRDSNIVLNFHSDRSSRFASNMRMFEATGVGALLITDWKDNISDLFRPDEEVLVFRTPGECVEMVKWALDHPDAARAIAQAGQRRSLSDHTFTRRAQRWDSIVKQALETGT